MTTSEPLKPSQPSGSGQAGREVLQAHDLSKAFGGVQAVLNLSFSLMPGELMAMIGPNGAGKTTCFHLLHGHLKPDQGSIYLNDQEITSKGSLERSRMGMARTFQVASVYPAVKVLDHLIFSDRIKRLRGAHWLRQVSLSDSAVAMSWLLRLQLDKLAHRYANELSYGDLKRLELAMVLSQQPKVLLMDEPTAGLPLEQRQTLMQLVHALAREQALAVLITEHAMDVVFGFADRLLVIHRGSLIAQGDAEAIAQNQQVREAYLGSLNLQTILASREQR